MSFALHHGQQCVLCSGCENDEEFDYCRACGFTKLPLFFPVMKIAKKNEQLREQLAAIAAAQQPLVDALHQIGLLAGSGECGDPPQMKLDAIAKRCQKELAKVKDGK